MRIISHRGAAGLASENSITGVELAVNYKVAYIEIDLQATKDGGLVLSHADYLETASGDRHQFDELTLRQINTMPTYSGHPIPLLNEALEAAGDIPLLIDCKGKDWGEPLAKILKNFDGPKPVIASRDVRQLLAFSEIAKDADCFVSELTKPYEAIQTAKALNFSGVCLQYSLYSPLVYFMAKRAGLRMTMYTVNKRWLAWFLHFFYPQVMITTDYPDRFIKHRRKPKK